MDKINKHNYEAYFLDYLEGNLSAEEINDLFVFLEKNPELKNELDLDPAEVSLDPSKVVFENKATLKVEDDSILTLNSVDAWMIDSVEKNLSASKQQELDDFIRKHQLEKTYTAYQSTLLKPDLNIVFEDKQKLKVATGVVIPLYMRVASIAAVGIILIGIAMNRFGGNEPTLQTKGLPENNGTTAVKIDAGVPQHMLAKVADQKNRIIVNKEEVNSERPGDNENGTNDQLPVNDLAHEKSNEGKDTISEKQPQVPDDVVDNDKKDFINPVPDDENDVVLTTFNSESKASLITEEPYKIVTDAASNFTNREINFTRERDAGTNEYVAFGFKIGNFEFERKKGE